MKTTFRALLSVLLLLGFYVVALGLVALFGLLTVWAFSVGEGGNGVKLGLFTLIILVSIVVALVRVARAQRQPPGGLVLREQDAPELWAEVRRLAQAADTRAPDEIRLVAEVNAAVNEESRFLGLTGGTRRLFLGVPLLQGLTVAQLRSVLAHELGHYSRAHTRLGPLTYRSRAAMIATVQQLNGNLVGWVLMQYTKLFLLASAAVSRSQELEADQISVRVAGRQTAASALQNVAAVSTAWDFYTSTYVGIGWDLGYAPAPPEVFSGFYKMLTGRPDELEQARARAQEDQHSRWDSHPSIGARIAAMASMPDAGAPYPDIRPGMAWVPGALAWEARVADDQIAYGERRRLSWDDVAAFAMPEDLQRTSDIMYRAVTRVTKGRPGGLSPLLDVLAGNGGPALAADLFPGAEPERAREEIVTGTRAALSCAATRSGVARWRVSWDGAPVELVRTDDGTELDLEPLARLAVDPATTYEARAELARLGVPEDAGVQVSARRGGEGADVVGGIAGVQVDGVKHDVLILDAGLILVPTPGKGSGTKGNTRLWEVARSAPLAELTRRYPFIALENVASAHVVKKNPVRVDLALKNGRTVQVRAPRPTQHNVMTEASPVYLLALVQPYVRDGSGRKRARQPQSVG